MTKISKFNFLVLFLVAVLSTSCARLVEGENKKFTYEKPRPDGIYISEISRSGINSERRLNSSEAQKWFAVKSRIRELDRRGNPSRVHFTLPPLYYSINSTQDGHFHSLVLFSPNYELIAPYHTEKKDYPDLLKFLKSIKKRGVISCECYF